MLALYSEEFYYSKIKIRIQLYLLYISNTYYKYIPICGNDPLTIPRDREMTSRPVPRDAGCANVREDDATAENQNDHSPGRPCS